MAMKIHLYYNNPALDWITEEFRYNLQLINGEAISITFDISSATTYEFTAQAVEELFGPKIIKGREEGITKHLDEICQAIADVLNEGMAHVASDIVHQTLLSFLILGGLDTLTKHELLVLCSNLENGLLVYYKQNTQKRWINWMKDVIKYINTR